MHHARTGVIVFDHVVTVFSSGYTALAAFIFILFFEMKYFMDFTPVFRRRTRTLMLTMLGVYFVLTSSEHSLVAGTSSGMQAVSIDMQGVAIALATLFGGVATGGLVTGVEVVVRLLLQESTMLAEVLAALFDYLLVVSLIRYIKVDPDRVLLKQIVYAGGMAGLGEASVSVFAGGPASGWGELLHLGMELFLIQMLGTLLFGWLQKVHNDRFRGRAHGRLRIKHLNETMKQALVALSTAMVHHDLSTAGHEQRVADLARRVGMMLGLSDVRLEGLQLAAMVHDVGQIRVPRDILTRPRQLSSEEFELVKMHVEAGYHILKDIPFPWPIADIVRQHHEHMDGSGYPNGLHGEQILLEARILHACDALEAMMSHRPFRRAFNAEHALAELDAYKGVRYDAKVVDAIMTLFRDLDYAFPVVKLELPL